jgi:hypothetical protein
MQVKVSYTSDLEDVPDEVANISNTLSKDIEKFQKLMQEASVDLSNREVVLAKLKLKTGMEKLQKMFARLTDCQVILEGYEKVKNPQNQEQKQETSSNQ